MKVSKQWLENKVKELNESLQENKESTGLYQLTKRNRDYYVSKLIELEESELSHINV